MRLDFDKLEPRTYLTKFVFFAPQISLSTTFNFQPSSNHTNSLLLIKGTSPSPSSLFFIFSSPLFLSSIFFSFASLIFCQFFLPFVLSRASGPTFFTFLKTSQVNDRALNNTTKLKSAIYMLGTSEGDRELVKALFCCPHLTSSPS
jgi:hypothetical protein